METYAYLRETVMARLPGSGSLPCSPAFDCPESRPLVPPFLSGMPDLPRKTFVTFRPGACPGDGNTYVSVHDVISHLCQG